MFVNYVVGFSVLVSNVSKSENSNCGNVVRVTLMLQIVYTEGNLNGMEWFK